MKEKCLYLLLGFLCITGLYGQEHTVTGVVKDEAGQPLLGVSVLVKGTQRGVDTDINGKYSIKVPDEKAVLVFSMVGSKPTERKVGLNREINITLKEDVTELTGLVFTGYQEINKKLFTGNSQTLKIDDIKQDGVVDVARMLEGRSAGVNVQNLSGTFGTSPKITIRGGSSIFGDTKPLWVVDGAVQEEVVNLSFEQLASGDSATLISSAISGLNANDIESIEILKDASALSLYGARALNGAVIITTKSGKKNIKTQLNYQLEESVRMIPNYSQFDIMNSQETMSVYRELEQKGFLSGATYAAADQGGPYHIMYRNIDTYNPATGRFLLENSPEARNAFLRKYEYANTDWFKTLFRPSLTQNHTLSLSGGSENATIYSSLGFFVDPGWSIADKLHRITGNIKTSYNLSSKVKIGVLAQGSIRNQKAPGTFSRSGNVVTGEYNRNFDINPFSYALNTSRALRPYDDKGDYDYYRMNYAPMNILKELKNNYIDLKVMEYKLQGDLEVKFTPEFKYKFLGSVRYVKSTNEHSITEQSNVVGAYRANDNMIIGERNPFLYKDPNNPSQLPQVVLPNGGIYKLDENDLQSYYLRNAFEYNKTLKDEEMRELHALKFFLGQEFRYTDRDNQYFEGYGYQFNRGGVVFTEPLMLQKVIGDNSQYFDKSFSRERGVAFFSQASYGYRNRYILAGTLNYEGTNQLGRSRSARWLPTWNISGRWNASNERFLEGKHTLSNLSFRLSYGLIAGLANAGNALPIFTSDITNRYRSSYDESLIRIISLQNSNLTWEKVYETNFGTDIGLFGNKINLSLDLYQKNSKDLMDIVRTSGMGGEIYKYANDASMVTRGFELVVDTRNFKTDDFSWNTSVNFAYFNQEITALANSLASVFSLVRETGGNVLGGARNTLYSYDFIGLNNQGMPMFNLKNGSTNYQDIDFQDRDNILSYLKKEGAVDPNITGGLSNTFRYKNWELSFLITMQAGNKIRKAPRYSATGYSDLSVFPKEFKNRWMAPGDEATTNIPGIVSTRTLNETNKALISRAYSAYNNSTQRVVDGSFVRMKSISLSYTFPKEVLESLKLSNLTLRLQASNPFLIYAHKDLNGQDPEFFRSGGVSYPITPQYTFTINFGI